MTLTEAYVCIFALLTMNIGMGLFALIHLRRAYRKPTVNQSKDSVTR